jgi:hypothetical protein
MPQEERKTSQAHFSWMPQEERKSMQAHVICMPQEERKTVQVRSMWSVCLKRRERPRMPISAGCLKRRERPCRPLWSVCLKSIQLDRGSSLRSVIVTDKMRSEIPVIWMPQEERKISQTHVIWLPRNHHSIERYRFPAVHNVAACVIYPSPSDRRRMGIHWWGIVENTQVLQFAVWQ